MTDKELEAAQEQIRLLQRQIGDDIHELLNVLTVIRGEVDLAVQRARAALERFYSKHPDMRD